MRISDWSSDVCSSDLLVTRTVDDAALLSEGANLAEKLTSSATEAIGAARALLLESYDGALEAQLERETRSITARGASPECREGVAAFLGRRKPDFRRRSEEHTSELQSLMRNSYPVFCVKKKNT